MSSSDARPRGPRLPLSSITREVPVSELAPLIDATRPRDDMTRPHDEADTAAMDDAEMDRLLAPERFETPVNAQAPALALAPVHAQNPAPIPSPPAGARIAVAPTHVPLAPIPARLSEPTVVLTQDAFAPAPSITGAHGPVTMGAPSPPAASSWGVASPSGAPQGSKPGSSTTIPFGMAPPPDAATARAPVPDWAATHLPPSRQKVRTARNTKLYLVVAALSLLAGSIGAAVVMLHKGPTPDPSGEAGVPPGQTGEPSGRATVPSGTGDVPTRTGDPRTRTEDVPTRTGDPRTRTEDVPTRTGESPTRTTHLVAPPGTPEFEAKEALTRLREGLATCVRDVIHTLPGTSPPVPEKLAAMRGGAYKSAPRDFRSPVFSCLKYRETKPQRFQIQWQVTMQPSEGRGVAWLDDDGDGKADRAVSFRAVLVRKNEVELGEIGLLSPVPDVMLPRP